MIKNSKSIQKVMIGMIAAPLLLISTLAFADSQSVAIVNQSTDANPIYLCLDLSNTTASNPYNLSPNGQAWLTESAPGQLAYNFSLDPCPDAGSATAQQKAGFFSYAGGKVDANSGYVYSGRDKDTSFPFYVNATAGTTGCPQGAASCLNVSLDPNYQIKTPTSYATIPYRGVNFPGFEFGQKVGDTWTVPLKLDATYFVNKGMNTIRLPLQLMYIMPDPTGSVDSTYFDQYNNVVTYLTGKGIKVIVDVHNYMRYNFMNPSDIKDPSHTIDSSHSDYLQGYLNTVAFLASQYKDNPNVIFELMNEPHDMDTQTILDTQNKAIAAIRNAGATNLILLSGNDWSHMNSWVTPQYQYGTPNAQVFLPKSAANPNGINDPANNYAIDVHEYFTPGAGNDSASLNLFANWLRANNMKGFIGEIGIDRADSKAIQSGNAFISSLEQNSDVIIGWTVLVIHV